MSEVKFCKAIECFKIMILRFSQLTSTFKLLAYIFFIFFYWNSLIEPEHCEADFLSFTLDLEQHIHSHERTWLAASWDLRSSSNFMLAFNFNFYSESLVRFLIKLSLCRMLMMKLIEYLATYQRQIKFLIFLIKY